MRIYSAILYHKVEQVFHQSEQKCVEKSCPSEYPPFESFSETEKFFVFIKVIDVPQFDGPVISPGQRHQDVV